MIRDTDIPKTPAERPEADLYDHLDPVGQQIFLHGDSWTDPVPGTLAPGLYLTDPQGHALLVGTNGRALTLIDFRPRMAEIGSVRVESPDLLDELADRLKVMAQRMRDASAREAGT